MSFKPLIAAVLGTTLLAGCAAVPGAKPELTQATPASMGLSGPQTVAIAPDWWTAMGDPQLDRIMADALAGSPTLDAALARVRVAAAQIQVKNAARLPHVDVDASEQLQRFSDDYIIPPPYGGTDQWIGSVQANLNWSLDLAGKQKAMVEQARAEADAAALDADAARVTLSGAVAQTYLNYARADAQAQIAARFVAARQTSLALAQRRKASQLADDFEIHSAQALLAEAKQAQVRAEGNRTQMVHALAALAGRGADYYATIGAPSVNLAQAVPVPAALPLDLLGRRPDILAAKARIEASDAGRRAAKAAFYPDLDLSAFAGLSAIGLSTLFTGGAFTAGIGPALHLPIFEGGKLKADYKSAVGQIDVAVANYNSAVVDAVKQSSDALTQIGTDKADADQQQAIVSNLRETLRLDGVRVRTGLGSRVDELAANDRLLSAEMAQANIQADSAVHRVQLLVALGGGFDPISPTPLALAGAAHAQRQAQ